jgi:hypothetical protein
MASVLGGRSIKGNLDPKHAWLQARLLVLWDDNHDDDNNKAIGRLVQQSLPAVKNLEPKLARAPRAKGDSSWMTRA